MYFLQQPLAVRWILARVAPLGAIGLPNVLEQVLAGHESLNM